MQNDRPKVVGARAAQVAWAILFGSALPAVAVFGYGCVSGDSAMATADTGKATTEVSTNAQAAPGCGDRVKAAGETCDDHNTNAGDGCNIQCKVEPGYSCLVAGSACAPVCGDGIQTSGEACDDGNVVAADGCSPTCTLESASLCTNDSANLVSNGGFDQGNTGFTSSLTYNATSNRDASEYGISTGNGWRPDACSQVPDAERSAGNNSLYFNGSADPQQVIYQTSVSVAANTDYIVEAYAMSWGATAAPKLFFTLGDVALSGVFTAVACAPTMPWTRVSATYHSTGKGPVTLKVMDKETAFGGNDGALDGFSVRKAKPMSCGRVSVDAPAPITAANAAAYSVSGTCFTGVASITVGLDTLSAPTICSNGRYTATFDATALASAASIAITASQASAAGTISATASTSKIDSCADSVRDGAETDVDCGGDTCGACADGLGCSMAADCTSGVCADATCAVPTCSDTIMNASETDVDCGGATCGACADGQHCEAASDCASEVCKKKKCSAPTCADGIKNGSETDTDCGGTCSRCDASKACNSHVDCTSDTCTAGICADDRIVFLSSATYNGNMGGLAGADALCANLASGVLGGTFKAYLSTSSSNATDRLTHATGKYKTTAGTIIAANDADFFSAAHTGAIDRDENGATTVGTIVWTGTGATGVSSAPNCSDWTSSGSGVSGSAGLADFTDSDWTTNGQGPCDQESHIYCVLQ